MLKLQIKGGKKAVQKFRHMEIQSPDTGFNIPAKTSEDGADAMLECSLENWRKQLFISMKSTHQKDHDN